MIIKMNTFKSHLINSAQKNDLVSVLSKLHLLSVGVLDELALVTTNAFLLECIDYCKGYRKIALTDIIYQYAPIKYLPDSISYTKKDTKWKNNLLRLLDTIHVNDLENNVPVSKCTVFPCKKLQYKDFIQKSNKISPHVVFQVIKEYNLEYELATSSRKKMKIGIVVAFLLHTLGYEIWASSSTPATSCTKSCSKLSKVSSGISSISA